MKQDDTQAEEEAEAEPGSMYKCILCGRKRKFVAWCDKDPFPLKCLSCNTLTLHKRILNQ